MCRVFVTSCATRVLLWKLLICCSLRSIGFCRLRHYYEAVRLLLTLRHTLDLQNLAMKLPFRRLADLPGMQILPLCARHALLTPTKYPHPWRFSVGSCCLRYRGLPRLPLYIYLTGLNRFTVSHCGSRTPMPTLKPHLTASDPRLSTDCSLRFVGLGLSPCFFTCTELAHPSLN